MNCASASSNREDLKDNSDGVLGINANKRSSAGAVVASICLLATLYIAVADTFRPRAAFTFSAPLEPISGSPLVAISCSVANNLNRELALEDNRSSCNCASGLPQSIVLKPHEVKSFTVNLRCPVPSRPSLAQNEKELLFAGVLNGDSPYQIGSRVRISWPIICTPWKIEIDGVDSRSAVPTVGVIHVQACDVVSDIQVDGPGWMSFVVHRIHGSHEYEVLLRPNSTETIPDDFTFNVRLTPVLERELLPAVSVPITGTRVRRLSVRPSNFHFGVVQPNEVREFELLVANKDVDHTRVFGVSGSQQVHLLAGESQPYHLDPLEAVHIQGTVACTGVHEQSCEVFIEDKESASRISVPLRYHVKPETKHLETREKQ